MSELRELRQLRDENRKLKGLVADISRPRVLTWIRRTFAAAFVALGAKLALADR